MASLINFTSSGTARVSCPQTGQAIVSGALTVIDPESASVVASTSITGSITAFTITGAHTSKESYLVVPSAFGYSAESKLYEGLSPTIEVYSNDFQVSGTLISGTSILSKDFEDASTSGLILTVTGAGGITQSGLRYSTNMQSNYYIGLSSSSDNSIVIEPIDNAASGINCGRTIFLARGGTAAYSVSTDSAVGVAFLRQDSTITSNCYKVILSRGSVSSGDYNLTLYSGQMTNGSGIIIGTSTSLGIFTITFSNKVVRDPNRLMWICVEWEVLAQGILIRIFYKLYNAADTIEYVKNNLTLVEERIHTGIASGAEYYTTSPGKVAWLLGSDSTSTGDVGIDCINLEVLDTLKNYGLRSLNLLAVNNSGIPRPIIRNILGGNFNAPPQGSVKNSSTFLANPFIPPSRSIYNKPGCGYTGIRVERTGGSTGDTVYSLFDFSEDIAKSIKNGVCRTCVLMPYLSSLNVRSGLAVLRQGPSHDSNSYVVELCFTGSATPVLRIRKGQTFSTTLNNSANLTGSVVATSSALPYTYYGLVWVEVRWVVEPLQTKLEVLYSIGNTGYFLYDTSPGTVDYTLKSILTYTDITSPYITTSESPMLILLSTATSAIDLYNCELRKCKYGN